MHKKNKSILSCVLMIVTLQQNLHSTDQSNNIWNYVGAAAATVAAGIGAYKLLEWCFYETNAQLIERAEREYKHALRFVEDGTLSTFKGFHNLSCQHIFDPVSSYDITAVLDTVYEPALYSLARWWFDRGIPILSAIDDIIYTNRVLCTVSDVLHKRIAEHGNRKVPYHEAKYINTMRVLVDKIDHYIQHLGLLSAYLIQHRTYFVVFCAEADLQKKYDAELRIINLHNPHYVMINDICQCVIWNNGGLRYPYISYVEDLSDDSASLKRAIKALSYRYNERLYYANGLLKSLEWIKNSIVLDARYIQEVYQKEEERLRQLKIEALQDQLCIERAQLAAQREYNKLQNKNF